MVERVDPLKDVDGFHPFNFGLLAAGSPRFVPCTPLGIRELLDPQRRRDARGPRGGAGPVADRGQADGVSLASERAGGRRDRDGLPHRPRATPPSVARQADLLIVAMGRPEQVTADWVKPGAVVIDVGIHKRDDGRLCGDVDFASVAEVASRITPVPGGVGPLTIAMLLRNTLMAAGTPAMPA